MANRGYGAGPRLPILARPRTPQYLSLLSAVDIEPNPVDRLDDAPGTRPSPIPEGPKWLNGVRYRREPLGTGGVFIASYDATTHAKQVAAPALAAAENDYGVVYDDPFTVYGESKHTTYGFTVNDYIGRATRQLQVTEAYQVEREFWTGTARKAAITAGQEAAADQWLAQTVTPTILNGGAAMPLGRAIGQVQQAMADVNGGEVGMMHFPTAALQPILTLQIATPVPPPPATGAIRNVTRIVDQRGNVLVAGLGYGVNTSPGGVAATGAATYNPTQAWIYGTGMLRIWRDDIVVVPDTYAQALDRTVNDIDFRAQRSYLVDWDRSTHIAVLADLTSVPGY